jgi:integrase
VRTIPGWPQRRLSCPWRRERLALPLSAFPETFQRDVAQWRERVLKPDPFDESHPARPLRETTVRHRITQIRIFASALVGSGARSLEDINDIRCLLEPDNFKQAIRVVFHRTGKTSSLYNMACTMRLIGKHYCGLPDRDFKLLIDICQRLALPPNRQLTEKNRRRLRQFDDRRNVVQLLKLPAKLAAEAATKKNSLKAAKCIENALVISLLLHCGLRLRALALRLLELEDFKWSEKTKCTLHVPAAKQKTDRALELELDAETAGLLKSFLGRHRRILPNSECSYLFPGIKGGPRSDPAMFTAICRTVRKRTGLEVNPHLFRHLLAKLVVEADPSSYPAVSQVLGHKSLSMTMAHYLGAETKASGRHIDKLLSEIKRA